jgi:hypothetical protein
VFKREKRQFLLLFSFSSKRLKRCNARLGTDRMIDVDNIFQILHHGKDGSWPRVNQHVRSRGPVSEMEWQLHGTKWGMNYLPPANPKD